MQLNILQIVNVARSVRNENEDYESKSNKITKDRDFMFKKQNIYIYEHQQQHTKYHTCKIDHCTDTYYQLSKKIIHYPLVKQHLMSLSSHCYDLFFFYQRASTQASDPDTQHSSSQKRSDPMSQSEPSLGHSRNTISLMYFSVAGERWKEDRRHTRSRENRGKKKNKIHLIKYFL